ncbi:flagellar hook protein FlgE [Pseudorhodobacter sp. MZDSW-24AT]|uniref:flagellar hook protein FlgE n=1 Tax=Pseudorhodobacter sp. MZDSW-24AT TaxID=2052957 RepID=UPI000C1E16F4|nr:flagellar hook-basal body complex protein [Pseudorhodobacter sp. MZDSW-24AT]PJF09815.1 flagellar biosynthesis protein FlgE [Pseudorhodobacter sp. MZDSW-24AT]
MTISSSLNAGVAGLNANATKLATISDNIANASTYGYKRAATDFESMVIGNSRGAGKYSAGGVRASSSRLIDERGAIVGTANALDLAVSGRGMLPVIPSVKLSDGGLGTQPIMMTTTGSFRIDADGVVKTDSGLVLLGWPANISGDIPIRPRDSASGLEAVVIRANQTAADPTTRIGLGINLPASDTAVGASGAPIPLSVQYYSNLGTTETLTLDFTPGVPVAPATSATNSWTMVIRDSASNGAVVGEYELTFDDTRGAGGTLASVTTTSGGAYSAAAGTIALSVAGGPIALSLGRPGQAGGVTQLADSFLPTAITRDGSPTGNLTAVEVDENGYVNATYDTGFVRRLYQIPLVDVPNVNGLTALGNQTFEVSPDSGSFLLWDAGDGPTGSVMGFAREGSATDVAAELTALITTQRAYSSNAKVIQTVDEMLQETTNIKR